MKEVAYNKHHDQKGFLFIFDIPETEGIKGVNDVAVTIHIPPYSEYGKMPDTQKMNTLEKTMTATTCLFQPRSGNIVFVMGQNVQRLLQNEVRLIRLTTTSRTWRIFLKNYPNI